MREKDITQTMGYVGCVDKIRLVGEVGGDLWEQVGWKAVEGGHEGIDMTTQHCERRVHIIL